MSCSVKNIDTVIGKIKSGEISSYDSLLKYLKKTTASHDEKNLITEAFLDSSLSLEGLAVQSSSLSGDWFEEATGIPVSITVIQSDLGGDHEGYLIHKGGESPVTVTDLTDYKLKEYFIQNSGVVTNDADWK